MSGTNNSHKLNGNLIVSGATTVTKTLNNNNNSNNIGQITDTAKQSAVPPPPAPPTAATPAPAAATTATTINKNNKHNLIEKQQLSTLANNNNKLSFIQQQHQQQQPNIQRRSLLPSSASTTVTNNQQPPSSGTALNSTIAAYPNQLQTVATIHHQHTQQLSPVSQSTVQQQQQQQQQESKSLLQQQQQQIRRSLHSLHAHTLKASAHNIPPRYQPPPQPQQQQQQQLSTTPTNISGFSQAGILKHLKSLSQQNNNNNTTTAAATTTKTTSATNFKNSNKFYFGASENLNFKYPPDIPQLSSIYLPESFKAHKQAAQQNGATRYLTNSQQQQQQQIQGQRLCNNGLLNGHQTVTTLQQQNVDKSQQDMLKFVRKPDQDHPSPNASVTSSSTGIPTANGRLTAEQNRQLQSLINELRSLKEQNQRLLDDNQELRDLCCFLDDDRQKGRKLAREWQRFGRYTASVMRQEVAAYQNKLRQLDDKQQELITDNLELKELCLYLDEERLHVAASSLCANCGAATNTRNARDDGDGSSSSTNADETLTALRNYERQLPTEVHLRTTLNDQTLQYVRSLERRIQQLEEERLSALTPTAQDILAQQQQQQQQQQRQQQQQQQQQQSETDNLAEPISGRPEAVVRALQVLEVREQLERDRLGNLNGTTIDQMDDGEKALVREMCNVVWRKLEGSPNGGTTTLEPL